MSARTDSERLDWLGARMFVDTRPMPPVYVIEVPMHDCPDPRDATIRNAADSAMDAEREREGG